MKLQLVLATLLTVALLALAIGPIMGAEVLSVWSIYPYGSWFGFLGGFGWLFPQFPYPF
ncbi:MAG: hypothetical protein QW279_02490 [Candidatus Jordarchaeaceae archaeon]